VIGIVIVIGIVFGIVFGTVTTTGMMIAIHSVAMAGRPAGQKAKRQAGETAMCLRDRRRNTAVIPTALRIIIPKDTKDIVGAREGAPSLSA
jgi:hypothetical protein